MSQSERSSFSMRCRRRSRRRIGAAIVFAACSAGSLRAFGQVAYTYSSSSYTQNFDTLPNGKNYTDFTAANTGTVYSGSSQTGVSFTLPSSGTEYDLSGINSGGSGASIPGTSALTGWYALSPSGATNDYYGASGGAQSTGGLYSFGAVGGSNRALGALATSASGLEEFGLLLYNSSTTTYNQFSLAYSAELWRQQTTGKTLNFGYQVSTADTAIPTSPANSVSLLGSGTFGTGTSTGSTDQSAPYVTNSVSDSNVGISGTLWAPGDYLWLTFTMSATTSGGQGIGIDNFSFQPSVRTPDVWNNGTTWDTSSTNWLINGAASKYTDGDAVQFANTNVGSVTIQAGGVNPSSTSVTNTSGTYRLLNAASATAGIGGSGSVTMSGVGGTLDLSGLTVANTYSGGTNFLGGTVIVSNDNQLGNTSGGLAFNGGTLRAGSGITSARAITLTGAGTFDTGVNSSSLSSTFSGSGTLNVIGSGTLTLTGSGPSGNTAVGSGATLVLGQSSGTVTMSADSTGSAFAGNLDIANGIRFSFNSGSLSGGGGVFVQSTGAYLDANGATLSSSIGNLITLNNGGTFTPGNVSAAPYTPDTFVTGIGATAGNQITIAGGLSGTAAGVDFQAGPTTGGAGTVVLSSQLSYGGTTQINMGKGTIVLGTTNALPTSTDVIVSTNSNAGSPTLDLHGYSQTLSSLSVGANAGTSSFLSIVNNGSGAATLTIGGSVVPANAFIGTIADGSSQLNLVKSGSGTLKLDHNSPAGVYSYSGTTTVSGGLLQITSGTSLSGTGNVLVNGGTFGGNGSVAGAITASSRGTIFEGGASSVGSLTVSNSVTMNSSSTLSVRIQQPGTGNTGTEGTDNDTLFLTGSNAFNLNGANLNVIPEFSTFTSSIPSQGYTYTIVDAGSSGTVSDNQSFANLSGGNTFSNGAVAYTVSYNASSITIDVTAVPEPASLGLLGMGAVSLLRRRRRAR